MRILVTGASGQLGGAIKRIADEFADIEFVFTTSKEMDICDVASVEAIFDMHKPSAIINCAAATDVEKAEREPDWAMNINGVGAGILANICAKQRVVMIQVSTDYIVDGETDKPYTETAHTNPLNAYGRSKLEGERRVMDSGCSGAIVRTSWLYSWWSVNFFTRMVEMAQNNEEIGVVHDQISSPTYSLDLARTLVELARMRWQGVHIYNFSSEGELSWYEFAKAIFVECGLDVTPKAITTAERKTIVRRPKYSVLSKDKIRALGVVVPEWSDGLKRCVEDSKKIK